MIPAPRRRHPRQPAPGDAWRGRPRRRRPPRGPARPGAGGRHPPPPAPSGPPQPGRAAGFWRQPGGAGLGAGPHPRWPATATGSPARRPGAAQAVRAAARAPARSPWASRTSIGEPQLTGHRPAPRVHRSASAVRPGARGTASRPTAFPAAMSVVMVPSGFATGPAGSVEPSTDVPGRQLGAAGRSSSPAAATGRCALAR